MRAIVSWLSLNAPSAKDKHGIGSVIRTGEDMFAWTCEFGCIKAGQEKICEQATQEVLKRVQPNRTRRRIIILNPCRRGKYEVPVWWQNLNKVEAGKGWFVPNTAQKLCGRSFTPLSIRGNPLISNGAESRI